MIGVGFTSSFSFGENPAKTALFYAQVLVHRAQELVHFTPDNPLRPKDEKQALFGAKAKGNG
ncbi:MAG: hypothetical protein HY811_11535 [Planctomycetes bacterium]|nr:hypothetical protein [Planctomycetota bacterium]